MGLGKSALMIALLYQYTGEISKSQSYCIIQKGLLYLILLTKKFRAIDLFKSAALN